jgi:hypothetical protein
MEALSRCSNRALVFPVVIAAFFAASGWLAAAPGDAQPGPSSEVTDPELKRIEGLFERTFQTPNGQMFRTEKRVKGNRSFVTTYDAGGNVIEAHSSTIKVEQQGPVKVLTYWNREVTAGPAQGTVRREPASYIYRMEGDQFFEVWGILEGDKSPPRMFVWKRIDEPAGKGVPAPEAAQKKTPGGPQ